MPACACASQACICFVQGGACAYACEYLAAHFDVYASVQVRARACACGVSARVVRVCVLRVRALYVCALRGCAHAPERALGTVPVLLRLRASGYAHARTRARSH
eukprot:6211392-Pleurochrysis_carterae.AAC.1